MVSIALQSSPTHKFACRAEGNLYNTPRFKRETQLRKISIRLKQVSISNVTHDHALH